MPLEPDILKSFSDEMLKVAMPKIPSMAQIGKGAVSVAKRFGEGLAGQAAAPLAALHPTGKYLKKGWQSMSNLSPENLRSTGDYIRAKGLKGHAYGPDFHSGMGVSDALRRSGWLSNTPKYVGSSHLEKARNMAWRATPGHKSLTMLPVGSQAYSTMKQKVDPETGRAIGMGERAGGALVGLGSGVTSMGLPFGKGIAGGAGAMVGGTMGATVGDSVGRRVGRALDQGVAKFRGKPSLTPEQLQAMRAGSQS